MAGSGGGGRDTDETVNTSSRIIGARTVPANNERQRNVNWDSPIKVHFEIGGQGPVANIPTTPEDGYQSSSLRRRRYGRGPCKGDDDGFESLNGKSSSGDESHLSEQLRTTGDDGSLASDLMTEEVDDGSSTTVAGEPQQQQQQNKHKQPKMGKGDHSDTDSNAEWCGVTTNSEECSYSSDMEHTDSQDFAPTVILNSNCGAMDRSE